MATIAATPPVKCQEGAIYKGPNATRDADVCADALWKDQNHPFVATFVKEYFTLEKKAVTLPPNCLKEEFDSHKEARDCETLMAAPVEDKYKTVSNAVWKIEKYQIGTPLPTQSSFYGVPGRVRDFFVKRDGRPYKIEANTIKPFDECYEGAVFKNIKVGENERLCAYELTQIKGSFFGIREQGVDGERLYNAKYNPSGFSSSNLDAWSNLVARYSMDSLSFLSALAVVGLVDYPIEHSAQIVPCEDGAVLSRDYAASCNTDLERRTKLPHFRADVSANSISVPQQKVLPLDVDNCIHGGMMSSEELSCCTTYTAEHLGEYSSLFKLGVDGPFGDKYYTIKPSAEYFLCRTTGLCGR